jgi:uncharacterized membrane protein
MNEILAKMSLPNLHPAMVHWPIVLLTIAFLFDVVAVILVSKEWIRKTALVLFVLGALFASLTYWSGKEASETVDLSAGAQPVLAEHEELANYTLRFFAIYTAVRLGLLFFVPYKRLLHGVVVVLALPGLYWLFETADHGGALVYKHGTGVTLPTKHVPAPAPTTEVPSTPSMNLGPTVEGNQMEWNFQPGAEAELGKYFETPSEKIQMLEPKVENFNGKTALTLVKKSPDAVELILKPLYKDAQIEVDLDRSEFQGKVSLIQHEKGSDYDYFSTDSTSAVLGRSGKSAKIFDQMPYKPSSGWMKLKAVAAGDHYRGYLNGKMIAHGHSTAGPEGKVGIILDGTGKLRITRIAVQPVTETHD